MYQNLIQAPSFWWIFEPSPTPPPPPSNLNPRTFFILYIHFYDSFKYAICSGCVDYFHLYFFYNITIFHIYICIYIYIYISIYIFKANGSPEQDRLEAEQHGVSFHLDPHAPLLLFYLSQPHHAWSDWNINKCILSRDLNTTNIFLFKFNFNYWRSIYWFFFL